MLPQFLCLGFQKCGTTTLYEILKQHHGIVLTRDVKEPMYYRVPSWFQTVRGKSWYEKRYYGHIAPDDPRTCGEVNAGLTFSDCAKKIAKDFPRNTKFVVMLRNPVERSYSAYKYFLARGFLAMDYIKYDEAHGHAKSFDYYVHKILDNPEKSSLIMKNRLKYLVFSQSNYTECLEDYFEFYPRDNFYFILFEEFVKDQKTTCEEMFSFLELPCDPSIDYSVRANEGNRRSAGPVHSKIAMISKGFFVYECHELLHCDTWARRINSGFGRINRWIQSKCKIPDNDRTTVLPETYNYLKSYFEPEKRRLEVLLGRNLSDLWWETPQTDIKLEASI